MSKNDDFVTKQDLNDLEKRFNTSMEGFVQEILNALSPEIQEIKYDVSGLKHDVGNLKDDMGSLKHDVSSLKDDVNELKATTTRIENKLDATIDRVDEHTVAINELKQQVA